VPQNLFDHICLRWFDERHHFHLAAALGTTQRVEIVSGSRTRVTQCQRVTRQKMRDNSSLREGSFLGGIVVLCHNCWHMKPASRVVRLAVRA
jgi:hypothetical protein